MTCSGLKPRGDFTDPYNYRSLARYSGNQTSPSLKYAGKRTIDLTYQESKENWKTVAWLEPWVLSRRRQGGYG